MSSSLTETPFQRQLDELEGRVAHAAGETEQALRELVLQARAADDGLAQGWALVILGGALFYQGRFAEVIEQNEQALDLALRLGNTALESRALNGLGISRQKLGQYAQAFRDYTRSLKLSRANRDPVAVVRTLSNLAYLYRVHRQFDQAMTLLTEAQELLIRQRHPRYALSVSGNLAWTHIDAGNYQQALAITHLFLPEALAQPGTKYALQFHCAQAVCYLHLKCLPEALACASRAVEEAERQVEADADALSFVTLAEVLMALREFHRAEELLLKALHRANRSGSVMAKVNIKAKLARVYTSLGDQERAFEYSSLFFETQERLRDGGSDPLGMIHCPPMSALK